MTANFSNTPKVVHLIFHVSPKNYKMKIKEKRVTFVTLSFPVVPPGIVINSQMVVYHYFSEIAQE